MKIFLLFAFPREIKQVARIIGRHPSHVLSLVKTGMGVDNATGVFRHVLQTDKPDAVISLGYCGALSRDAEVGDLIWASSVCLIERQGVQTLSLPDERKLLHKLSPDLAIRAGTFLTMKEWMKKEEIIRSLLPEMTLPVCDMETFGLARLSVDRKVPFFAIRAVSDTADRELPFDPWSVCDKGGNYRATRALKLFLTHPRLVVQAMELLRSSKIASRNLARAASALLRLL